jgi:tetratricopeptide (TPR) repeat protein
VNGKSILEQEVSQMKDSGYLSGCSTDMRSQRGSSTYSFLGYAIVILVVIAAIFLPWGDEGKAPDPNMAAAEKAMSAKDWNKAITSYGEALKENPSNVEALVGRSRAYLQVGKLDKALSDATTAVEKRPSYAQGYGQRGIVVKLQGKNDAALQDFAKAVRLDPGYAWALAQRADLFMRQNNLDKALENVNQALHSQRNFVEALRLRAWIYNRKGQCKNAFEDFKKVEALSPRDPWSVQDRAWFLMTCPDEKVQDSAKALELAKQASEMPGGKDGVIFETLAEAYFRQGDPVKAAQLQKKALEMGSKKCPDGSCTKEMKERLRKYESATRQEIRSAYEFLPLNSKK